MFLLFYALAYHNITWPVSTEDLHTSFSAFALPSHHIHTQIHMHARVPTVIYINNTTQCNSGLGQSILLGG